MAFPWKRKQHELPERGVSEFIPLDVTSTRGGGRGGNGEQRRRVVYGSEPDFAAEDVRGR